MSVETVLEPLERVDLIDLDVQGVEAEALEPAATVLDRKARRVHVGTHSSENEERLRALFDRLGWECANDFPCGTIQDTEFGRIEFEDGVQTWLNPGLAPRG